MRWKLRFFLLQLVSEPSRRRWSIRRAHSDRNIALNDLTGICDSNSFANNMQNNEGINCFGLTAFKCSDSGSSTTFQFNEPDFCGNGQVADAVLKSFGRGITCAGGP